MVTCKLCGETVKMSDPHTTIYQDGNEKGDRNPTGLAGAHNSCLVKAVAVLVEKK